MSRFELYKRFMQLDRHHCRESPHGHRGREERRSGSFAKRRILWIVLGLLILAALRFPSIWGKFAMRMDHTKKEVRAVPFGAPLLRQKRRHSILRFVRTHALYIVQRW